MVTKKLLIGGLNTDDTNILIDAKEYIGALNIRFATSENGQVGEINNIEGNTLLNTTINGSGNATTFTLPTGTNTVIGSKDDYANNRVFFFVKNTQAFGSSKSHGIYCYDNNTKRIYTVLRDHQVSGGLNFNNYIHSIDIIGSILSWTDNTYDPKSINSDAAIKGNHSTYSYTYTYTFPIAYESSTVIKRPPIYALSLTANNDATFSNNYLKRNAFKFLYQYTYKDGQVSTLSTHSELIPCQPESGTINRIVVKMPFSETIPDDVQYIDIVARINDENAARIVKTFDRSKDSQAFIDHNAQATQLSFNFYNNEIGVALDSNQASIPYHAVPLKSKTLTYAKNRLFLANNTSGYDTPTITSVNYNLGNYVAGNTSNITAAWKRATLRQVSYPMGVTTYQTVYAYYAYDSAGAITKVYFYDAYKNSVSPPVSLAVSDATTGWDTEVNFAYWYIRNYPAASGWVWDYYYTPTFTTTGSTLTLTQSSSTADSEKFFKSGSNYKLSIVFYDRFRRRSGVVDAPKTVSIPDRTFAQTTFASYINWTLTNGGSTFYEIPDWAYYYQLVMTKSQTTRFFIQDLTNAGFEYVTKAANGTYTYASNGTAYSSSIYAIAISLDKLNSLGKGYAYNDGDLCRITFSTNSNAYTLSVLGQDSTKLLLSPINLGNSSNTVRVMYEIFTPYTASTSEAYYEVTDVFPVLNPGDTGRAYSVLSGLIDGDVYVNSIVDASGNYIIETMNPNNLYWKNWYTNHGWANFTTKLGSSVKKNSIMYSDVFVPGTSVNGLNNISASNETQLPIEHNGIQRLVLTSKVQAEGSVMVAIGTKETSSVYLGESQIFDSSGEAFLAKSSSVIGQVNLLRGSFGTINPESAFNWEGQVFWFDASKGAVIRYDVNGLFPISSNKMQKYFRKLGEDTQASGLQILMGIDPYHNEVLLTVPVRSTKATPITDIEGQEITYGHSGTGNRTVTITPGKTYKIVMASTDSVSYKGTTIVAAGAITGYFTAYDDSDKVYITTPNLSGSFKLTEVQRSFYDMDNQGFTLAYQPALDKWTSAYSFIPESMSLVGNRLLTFKTYPYIHSSGSYNTFYGNTYDSAIAFVHNEAGNDIKLYKNVSIEGDTPDLFHMRSESPNLQSSDLRGSEFEIKEGVNYMAILRDRLSPNVSGTPDQKLYKGDPMRCDVGKFQVVFFNASTKKRLKFANIGFVPSRGHTTQNS